jgi:plastocyanin
MKSISVALAVFVLVAVIILALAGTYIATTLPGSLPTKITTSATELTSSSSATYATYATRGPPYAVIYIMNGASQGKVESFNPQNSTVVIGVNNTVVWKNLDTANQTIVEAGNGFSSPNLVPTQTWNYTFTTPGTYAYSNPNFPWENGTITVTT